MVGGYDSSNDLSSVELFPPPPSDCCSIPDLPQGRFGHSLSLLSGGRLVVCGGIGFGIAFDSCISWVGGDTSWTHFHTMRCLPIQLIAQLNIFQFLCQSSHFTNQITEKYSTAICFSQSCLTLIVKKTITVWRDLITRPGRRPLFPAWLYCLAATAITVQQGSLQRLCQVSNWKNAIFYSFFTFKYRRWELWIKTQRRGCMRDSWSRRYNGLDWWI